MTLKPGYTSKDYAKDGQEVFRYFTIDGKQYRHIAVEILDRVGRVIGHKSLTAPEEVTGGDRI
jgi:hypothetical protein